MDDYPEVKNLFDTEMKYLFDALDEYPEKLANLERIIQVKQEAIQEMAFTGLEVISILQRANSALRESQNHNSYSWNQIQDERSKFTQYRRRAKRYERYLLKEIRSLSTRPRADWVAAVERIRPPRNHPSVNE